MSRYATDERAKTVKEIRNADFLASIVVGEKPVAKKSKKKK